jgi:hypothetical protein
MVLDYVFCLVASLQTILSGWLMQFAIYLRVQMSFPFTKLAALPVHFAFYSYPSYILTTPASGCN